MKRFWLKILLLAPLPLAIIGFNWFVDPVHLRSADQYEYGIARLVLAGKHVTNISNPDEAAFVKFIVDGSMGRKDVLVFGSSRSKLIRADSFPGLSVFNNSISGAGLVDYLAIYQMYRQKGFTPAIAVIELSPWILMRDYSSIWKTLNVAKRELEDQAVSPPRVPTRKIRFQDASRGGFTEFLSPGYFQTSFFTWLYGLTSRSRAHRSYFAWDGNTLPQGETLLADGSAIYPDRVQNTSEQERVLALAIEYGQKPIGIPEALDPDSEKVLEGFLDELLHDGVRPVLYLPPYHPRAYVLMVASDRNKIIVEEQKYFQTLAHRKGLTLVGSYNPADLSLDEADFFDGSHPTADAVRNAFIGHVPGILVGSSPEPHAAEWIELTGIDNPNGLERVNGKSFFWTGNGDSCLSVRCGKAGNAMLSFHASSGPSLPGTGERLLLLHAANGFAKLVRTRNETDVEVPFPVKAGLNQVRLTPLDKATVPMLSNGDRRPLLVGVLGITVKLLPDGATIPEEQDASFQLATGWYPVEREGQQWFCWTDGHGRVTVQAAKDMTAVITGEILSAQRPNHVDVLVNGTKVDTLTIDWKEWAFHPFPPMRVVLKAGENFVDFVSQNSAVTLPPDPRPLAIAVRNLAFATEKNESQPQPQAAQH